MFKAKTIASIFAGLILGFVYFNPALTAQAELDPSKAQIAEIDSVTGDTLFLNKGLADGIEADWNVRIYYLLSDYLDSQLIACSESNSAAVLPLSEYGLSAPKGPVIVYDPDHYHLQVLNLAYPHRPDTTDRSLADLYENEFNNLTRKVGYPKIYAAIGLPAGGTVVQLPDYLTLNQYASLNSSPYKISSHTDSLIRLKSAVFISPWDSFLDTINIHIIPDYLDRKIAFQTGEIDLLDLHFSDVDQFARDYKIIQGKVSQAAYLTVNNIKDFMSDGRFAAALSYLINKDALCRVALAGSAERLDHLYPQWAASLTYDYDPSKGRALLRGMGRVPKYVSLFVSVDDFKLRRTAEYIKGLLEREGVYTTVYYGAESVRDLDYNQFQEFDLMLSYINLNVEPSEIIDQMTFHYNLENITDNRSLYFSQEYDSIMATDQDELRIEYKKAYYRKLCEHPAGITLFQPIRHSAVSEHIKSIGFTADGYIDYSNIEIAHEPEK